MRRWGVGVEFGARPGSESGLGSGTGPEKSKKILLKVFGFRNLEVKVFEKVFGYQENLRESERLRALDLVILFI